MIAGGARGLLLDRCLERLAAVGSPTVAFETIVFLDGAGDDEAERLRRRVQGARVEASSVELGLAGALHPAPGRGGGGVPRSRPPAAGNGAGGGEARLGAAGRAPPGGGG